MSKYVPVGTVHRIESTQIYRKKKSYGWVWAVVAVVVIAAVIF